MHCDFFIIVGKFEEWQTLTVLIVLLYSHYLYVFY
jgi:hypothetical protein